MRKNALSFSNWGLTPGTRVTCGYGYGGPEHVEHPASLVHVQLRSDAPLHLARCDAGCGALELKERAVRACVRALKASLLTTTTGERCAATVPRATQHSTHAPASRPSRAGATRNAATSHWPKLSTSTLWFLAPPVAVA